MKTQLTKEQSQHLIDLGISKDYANWRVIGLDVDTSLPLALLIETSKVEPYFTLEALLEILPKEIELDKGHKDTLVIDFIDGIVYSQYTFQTRTRQEAEELIDSLYELCVWTIKNGFLKFE